MEQVYRWLAEDNPKFAPGPTTRAWKTCDDIVHVSKLCCQHDGKLAVSRVPSPLFKTIVLSSKLPEESEQKQASVRMVGFQHLHGLQGLRATANTALGSTDEDLEFGIRAVGVFCRP